MKGTIVMASPITISMDELRTLHAWEERALKKGLKVPELQASIDEPEQLERIIAFIRAGAPEWQVISVPKKRRLSALGMAKDILTYSAETVCRTLGLSCERYAGSIPPSKEGEMVIYYDSSWDLVALKNCAAGREFMNQREVWYNSEEWKAETGYYRVCFCVPNSSKMTWYEQIEFFKTSSLEATAAPLVVVLTALLTHVSLMGDNPLGERWCRCAEKLTNGACPAVYVTDDGMIRIDDDSAGLRHEHVFMSSATKC